MICSRSSPPPRSPPSSPPLKKASTIASFPSDGMGPTEAPLFIVRETGSKLHVHKIQVLQDGSVKGRFFDELPSMGVAIPEEQRCLALGSTALGSKLLMLEVTNVRDYNPDITFKFVTEPVTRTVRLVSFDVEKRFCSFREHNLSHFPEDLQYCFKHGLVMLIGASDKIYLLDSRISSSRSDPSCAFFESLDPTNFTWESLPPPPYSTSMHKVWGYVVVEEHDLILFCFSVWGDKTWHYTFCTFNILTKQWMSVAFAPTKEKSPSEEETEELFGDGSACPLCGKGEYVDGFIYAYLLRTIVCYRLTVSGDGAFLSSPLICREAYYYDQTPEDIVKGCFGEIVPAFQAAPFWEPNLYSRCLSYLGDNTFCAVETIDEVATPSGKWPVYITTFRVNIKESSPICILDSTLRLLNIAEGRACITFCFFPLAPSMRWKQNRTINLSSSFHPNWEDYIQEKVPDFCRIYFIGTDHFMPDGYKVYSKLKHEMDKSSDRFVMLFVEVMKYAYENGPKPNFVLLVDNQLDKRGLMTENGLDSNKRSDSCISLFIVCRFSYGVCGVYELEIPNGGVLGACQLSLRDVVIADEEDARFSFASLASLGPNLYLFESTFGGPNPLCDTITKCHVLNVKRKEVVQQSTQFKATKKMLMMVGCGSKIYAISGPSEYPDSIPRPAFECFDTVSNEWDELGDAPFHFTPTDGDMHGYAIVDDHIVVSLYSTECEFFSYNLCRKKWFSVEKSSSCNYDVFEGRAEYVDGKIYKIMPWAVRIFAVEKSQDHLILHPPRLVHLDAISPPIRWDEQSTVRSTHLGDKLFCVVETGSNCLENCQYACITTFAASDSGDIHTCSSAVCVLETMESSAADVAYCFSL